jgi:hypothetical protein
VEALPSRTTEALVVVKAVGVTIAFVMLVIDTPAEDVLMAPFTPLGKNPPDVTFAMEP